MDTYQPFQPYQQQNRMKPKIDIDTGSRLLTLQREVFKGEAVFTAYIDSISVRCGSLHIPRIRSLFLDSVVAACAIDDDEREDEVLDIADRFIADNL